MRDLVEVQLPDGQTMWVSVEAFDAPRDVGFGLGVPERVRDIPGIAEAARWAATNLLAGLRAVQPDRITAEFGLELAVGRTGIVAALCGVGGKAGIKVTMTWGPDSCPSPPEPTPAVAEPAAATDAADVDAALR